MTGRKAYLAAALLAVAVTTGATAADTPGVTATEIKIGNTVPYSGPASSYGVLGKLESAFFGMVNEQGGVAGHKIDFISWMITTARPRRSSRSAAWSKRKRSHSPSRPWARRPIARSCTT